MFVGWILIKLIRWELFLLVLAVYHGAPLGRSLNALLVQRPLLVLAKHDVKVLNLVLLLILLILLVLLIILVHVVAGLLLHAGVLRK